METDGEDGEWWRQIIWRRLHTFIWIDVSSFRSTPQNWSGPIKYENILWEGQIEKWRERDLLVFMGK